VAPQGYPDFRLRARDEDAPVRPDICAFWGHPWNFLLPPRVRSEVKASLEKPVPLNRETGREAAAAGWDRIVQRRYFARVRMCQAAGGLGPASYVVRGLLEVPMTRRSWSRLRLRRVYLLYLALLEVEAPPGRRTKLTPAVYARSQALLPHPT
jgi:hypothetical protein